LKENWELILITELFANKKGFFLKEQNIFSLSIVCTTDVIKIGASKVI
jgi:hypothetical protein